MLDEFQTAIVTRLQADTLVNTGVILQEDAADLTTAINNAIAQSGMVILVGQPSATNEDGKVGARQKGALMVLESEIGIGEDPTIWRDAADDKPHAKAFADAIVASLQGFQITGFQPLIVSDVKFITNAKRQLYNITVKSHAVVQPNET